MFPGIPFRMRDETMDRLDDRRLTRGDPKVRSGHKPRGRHPQHRLTAVHVRALKTPGRYADGNGLYLFVELSGAKRWIWRGVVAGKRCDLGVGPFALVSLADARVEALRLKTIAWKGGDPRAERRGKALKETSKPNERLTRSGTPHNTADRAT